MNKSTAKTNQDLEPQLGSDLQPTVKPVRRRRATTINLKWIAEKVRKANKIKEQLLHGKYEMDSTKTAEAILNRPKEEL